MRHEKLWRPDDRMWTLGTLLAALLIAAAAGAEEKASARPPRAPVTLEAADSLGKAIFARHAVANPPRSGGEKGEKDLAEVGAGKEVDPERWLRGWRRSAPARTGSERR